MGSQYALLDVLLLIVADNTFVLVDNLNQAVIV
jgi:hypothetical protein